MVLHSTWTLKNPGPDDSCDIHTHTHNYSLDIYTQIFNRHLKFTVLNSFVLDFSILSKWHHYWARCSSQTLWDILSFSSLNLISFPPHIPPISKSYQFYFQDISLIVQLNLYIHFYLQIVIITHSDYHSGLPAVTPAPVHPAQSRHRVYKKEEKPDWIIALYKVC